MADKIRREKTILKKSVDRYVKAVVKDYSKYFEGSPTYITYYQLNDMATLQDTALETVNSLAKLPSREVLLATVCNVFNAPIASFARAVQAIVDKNGEGAPAAEEAAE